MEKFRTLPFWNGHRNSVTIYLFQNLPNSQQESTVSIKSNNRNLLKIENLDFMNNITFFFHNISIYSDEKNYCDFERFEEVVVAWTQIW